MEEQVLTEQIQTEQTITEQNTEEPAKTEQTVIEPEPDEQVQVALPDLPGWVLSEKSVHEIRFCYAYREHHPMKCINGRFYDIDGVVSDDIILDFFEQAGDALTGLSLEQLITMLQGTPEQAQELAEEAKVIYSENTGDPAADESEQRKTETG